MKLSGILMGIDIGSSGSKGVLTDCGGRVIATAEVSHSMSNPAPGCFEHDAMQVWWHDFCLLSRELIESAGIRNTEILGVGCSTISADCLPVDRELNPLRPAILYGIDTRAQRECEELNSRFGEERLISLMGHTLCSSDIMPKILWVRRHEPEVFEKTYKFLTGPSFLVAKLTGRCVMDRYNALAAYRPMLDENGEPDPAFAHIVCRPDQLAQVLPTTEVVGGVSAEAARETGLAEGTPVTTGTGDAGAEAIGTGVLTPGDMMLMLGSSNFMILCSDRKVADSRLWISEYILPGTSAVSAGMATAGTLTRWFRDTLFSDYVRLEQTGGPSAYERMYQAAGAIPAGSDGLVMLPYFAGERTPINDPKARGVLFGLTLGHTREHLYRACLESVGYGIAQHFDIMRSLGAPIERVLAIGGGTRNPLWLSIIADITGETLQTAQVTVGAAYGDALLAGLGVGVFGSPRELKAIIAPGITVAPDPGRHAEYKPYRELYDELYPATRELMHRL
ncbi:FGGY-family carbohydrate kinase [Feifania hominis]|uniref:FGGY-family carbohydrate kinase n=1 Tax=Feifania hominis TaxID=2763660 RepID=A0A926HTE0_9FIRM|nr:FGGY-family carbohydrate kinase [Feifania hominis]MBC8535774.1 FGGY-family carbohydrate kinase [Feifania hominis]